jgi:CRISPR-associated endonuclease/helicase Cas3
MVGAVIALSATLPTETRCRLVNAYAKGCGCEEPEMPVAEYPRLTVFSPQGLTVNPFKASPHVTRSLNLHWVQDKEWAEALREKLSDGGCATVICSTVGRAQEVFQRLQKHFPERELGIFHGRFLFVDRDRIEKDCIAKFGKPNISERPERYVLVATQVIEQSLDLDFDLMISDIAPIDLILQRSGRLHRHEERKNRPDKLKNPTMWLIAPELSESGKADFGDSGFIYDRHVLLRSWLTLRHQTQVQLPEMMDSLIESVYDKNKIPEETLEPIYQEDWHTSLADFLNDESQDQAKADAVKLPPGFKGDVKPSEFTRLGDVDDDSAIAKVTRLGRESITTIFLQQTAEGLVLPNTQERINLQQSPDLKMIRSLLERSTRISKMGLVYELQRQENPKTWTSALLRHCRYVEVNLQGFAVVGKWKLVLDPQRGVIIDSA